MNTPQLVYVTDVYGDRHRIDRVQYDGGRVQITRYTDGGKRLSDWYAQMGWAPFGGGRSPTIHRGNIKEFQP